MTSILRTYTSLKPSGIRWQSEVPKYWHVRRLRTVAEMRVSNVDKHTKEAELPVRLCNYVDVYKDAAHRPAGGGAAGTGPPSRHSGPGPQRPAQALRGGVAGGGHIRPENWEIRRLRYLIQDKLKYGANAQAEFDNPDWPRYLRITDFTEDGRLREDNIRALPPEVAEEYLVEPALGDILLARSGATVGKAFLVPTNPRRMCHAGPP